jgi:hypothetical protein
MGSPHQHVSSQQLSGVLKSRPFANLQTATVYAKKPHANQTIHAQLSGWMDDVNYLTP